MNGKRLAGLFVLASALSIRLAAGAETGAPSAAANTLVIHADADGAVISRNLYGQFSEHLGHCIYEGLWVGEASPIPNTRGLRNDVIARPQATPGAGAAVARADVLRTNTIGKTAWGRARSGRR